MDLNMFRCCSGLRLLGYLIVVLVAAIIAVSYHAVVVVTWAPHLLDGGSQSFLSFAIVALFRHRGPLSRPGGHLNVILGKPYKLGERETWREDPGSVPENWKPSVEEGSSLTASDTWPSSDGLERRPAVGHCSHCQNGKPPRCHHCSVCQRCVLKMDHHCIWVVNCVGARNYKFFLLFVFYTFLETTVDTLALLPSFIKFFREAKHHSISPSNLAITFLAFVLNLAFALSLLCFVIMHLSLLSSNTTSVEVHEKKKTVRWKYDMGRKKNFEQVFGCRKALWFFPLFSKEDLEKIPALHGLDFPTLAEVEA